MKIEDTISAIATPLGEGGIAIIRMSGPDSEKILKKVFKSKRDLTPRYQYFGELVNPESGEIVDEVVVTLLKAPNSYTREDMVEISSHGGVVVAKKILNLLNNHGTRIAERGEFTKRAFLNGRIDLSQAEAVMDIITAKTDEGLGLAVKQLKGELAHEITKHKNILLEVLAHVEASLDFPDEDVDSFQIEDLKRKITYVETGITSLLKDFEKGKIYKDGINIAIIGRPNVGKSSLLNALLREKRAIVTDIPGTTRDTIEEYINIAGIPVKIIDTAGIRETYDSVERIGVDIAKKNLENADLVLYIIDASENITKDDEDILKTLEMLHKEKIVLINKVDIKETQVTREDVQKLVENQEHIMEISVKEGSGLSDLESSIEKLVFGGKVKGSESILVTRERHRELLMICRNNLLEALNALDSGLTEDFISIDIKGAWEALGKITGDVIEDDILDKVFSEFCIGK